MEPWSADELCLLAAGALRARAAGLDEEQSPYGLDALPEVGLHPALREGFAAAGLGALSEQRYPGSAGRPRRSEGDRCDIVLTRSPGEGLVDPLLEGTLFAGRGVRAEDACWVEVKTAHQFALTSGVAGANASYASELLRDAALDLRKLAREPRIARGALLLVVFTADEATAVHDLHAWATRCLDRGIGMRAPVVESFRLTDRIGNGACTVAWVEPRREEPAEG